MVRNLANAMNETFIETKYFKRMYRITYVHVSNI